MTFQVIFRSGCNLWLRRAVMTESSAQAGYSLLLSWEFCTEIWGYTFALVRNDNGSVFLSDLLLLNTGDAQSGDLSEIWSLVSPRLKCELWTSFHFFSTFFEHIFESGNILNLWNINNVLALWLQYSCGPVSFWSKTSLLLSKPAVGNRHRWSTTIMAAAHKFGVSRHGINMDYTCI